MSTVKTWAAYRDVIVNGLWKQNAGLVQFLGLCPLLAISTNLVNGFSLGLATALVTAITGAAVAVVRNWVPHEIRNPVFILIIAAVVTVVDLLLNAWVHSFYVVMGIFIPLITTNCIVLARAEAFASKNTVAHSALDGFMMGFGLTLVLAVLGALRELVGKGTLFSGIELVVGKELGERLVLQVLPADYPGFLLSLLPPGAFIGLGLLVALRNIVEEKRLQHARLQAASAPADDALAQPASAAAHG